MPGTDVAVFVGDYPYRRVPHSTPQWLLQQMDRLDIEWAWVSHLPSFLYKDPAQGNVVLEEIVSRHTDRFTPVPVVHPGLPQWEDDLNRAVSLGAPAVRTFPIHQGLDPAGGAMRVLAAAAGATGIPLLLTVKLEDVRQRHPLDVAPTFPAAAVRTLVRSDPDVKLVVTHADRSFVEEVHFGLTAEESVRLLWEISWIWGPPANDLALLLETVGVERFTFGSGMPLRVPDSTVAKLDLLDLTDRERRLIMGENLDQWAG